MPDSGLPGRSSVTIRAPRNRTSLADRQRAARLPPSTDVDLHIKLPLEIYKMLTADSRSSHSSEEKRAVDLLTQSLTYRVSRLVGLD